ncbi:MAG TPA: peroxiredoxin [Bryobacteraceae bacterium]|nr:peroxiredoxin [Bryobacteraceae bacterium]
MGAEAPDFTLPDQDGKAVTLSKLRGKNVVLVFYPADETKVCRQQLCEFRDRWPQMEAKDTVVFGVNPGSAKSHAAFRKLRNFPFPLLVDSSKQVAALYHADGPIIKRTVYLIGKNGRIRFAKRGKPLPEEVLAASE